MVNIYVGNLSWSCTNDDLMQLFSQHGTVARAQVILDRETGRSRGFGFVEMPNEPEAKTAVEALNNFNFQGRPLTVNEARPREPRAAGGGGGGGYGGGGGGYGGGGGGYGGGRGAGGGGGYGGRGGRY
jgi:RNA recognition motif-containing protein